ncbi:ComEC/Rec2 family competence protein [Candidatus Nomurabacteria bacterium]|nr:ComEC/Rec2 family competence protein [Candidatus Nomurabacteria bacterium]
MELGWCGAEKALLFSAPHLLFASVSLLAFGVGLLRAEWASDQFGHSMLAESVGREVVLSGVVVREPDQRERTVQLYVQTETDKVLVSTDRLTSVAYGDEVVVTGTLEIPEAFTTELGRKFDYAGYLKARGVEYRISFAEVEVAGSGAGNPLLTALLSAKQHFLTSLKNLIPEPAAGLGAGILLGVQSALGTDIEEDFRRTGIIHIVVLSGYNVMLVVAFILFCFSFFLRLRWRIVAALVAITAFAFIVGLSATVVRATLMAALVLLAQYFGRQYDVLRALMFAGVLMLLINPYLLIYDIGFQLSFMATLGLVLVLPQFESTVAQGKTRIGVREFFLSTLATQIAVLPLLMYHIGQVSLIALIVNVLVLPVVPIAMLLTFLAGVIGLVLPSLGAVVAYVATLSLQYILLVAKWFAAVPLAVVPVPAFSAWGVFLMYGALTILWYGWRRRTSREDALHGWTIEEEYEPTGAARASSLSGAPAKPDNLPIFFR